MWCESRWDRLLLTHDFTMIPTAAIIVTTLLLMALIAISVLVTTTLAIASVHILIMVVGTVIVFAADVVQSWSRMPHLVLLRRRPILISITDAPPTPHTTGTNDHPGVYCAEAAGN